MSGGLHSQLGLLERIHDFVVAGANNELTRDHWTQFEQLLLENESAYKLYFEYVEENDYLQTILQAMPDEDSSDPFCPNVGSLDAQDSGFGHPGVPAGTRFYNAFDGLSSGWPLAYIVATMVLSIGLTIAGITQVSRYEGQVSCYERIADRLSPTVLHGETKPQPMAETVGSITGMSNCVWNDAAGNSRCITIGKASS